MTPKISVVIPVYNQENLLRKTLESLKKQTFQDFEILVMNDCSDDNSAFVAEEYTKRVYSTTWNRGPAVNRNKGMELAEADIIAFTDSDCIVPEDWLQQIWDTFDGADFGVIVGNTKIKPCNYIGDSISALGHPGGGSMGFHNMWKVDKEGFAYNISSCNLAMKKWAIEKYGNFDESFPLAAGEELELSQRYNKLGCKIKYNPKQIIWHVPRDSLASFWRWHIYRGRGNYYIKKRMGKVGKFIKNKIWSSKKILRKHSFDSKLPMITFLLFLALILQQFGYLKEHWIQKHASQSLK